VSALGHVLFNLLANSVISFVLTLAIVYGTLRVFRFEPGRCRLWLLLLPFAKVLQELAAGVPASSFLWAKLAGRSQDLGTFRIGFGLQQSGPLLRFELGAFSGGLIYPQSLGDVLDAGLTKHFWHGSSGVLAAGVVITGAVRLARRWTRSRRFLEHTLEGARVVGRHPIGRRGIEIVVSDRYTGVPFATGVVRPRVVFSACSYNALTDFERDATLRHEVAHIVHLDLWLLAGLSLLDALFWYLPGVKGVFARIHAVLEQRADDAALAAGAEPLALASALVHSGELAHGPIPGAAMLSSRSLLARRVHRLLQATPVQIRSSKLSALARVVIAALVTITIAQALFLGNHVAALVRFAVP
jgi:hypothetical protein